VLGVFIGMIFWFDVGGVVSLLMFYLYFVGFFGLWFWGVGWVWLVLCVEGCGCFLRVVFFGKWYVIY